MGWVVVVVSTLCTYIHCLPQSCSSRRRSGRAHITTQAHLECNHLEPGYHGDCMIWSPFESPTGPGGYTRPPSHASWTRPGAGGSTLPRATRSLLVMLLLCADVVPLRSLDFILAMASQRLITLYFKPSPTSK
ncbi:hypothetical protein E2C01_009342 [Portunus trituberculatus]|uniref:Secreted protein n=1 Tax=Portunus trituberculatus TaxID=210409 RepID=A0A5B7D395_PORTR|nr:hypothetical protein [Portunus trituberculatus]